MSVETKKPDDITHRLRCKYPLGPIQANGEPEFGWRDFSGPIETILPTSLMLEAADHIDAQAAEIERLRSALEWYANMSKRMGKAALRSDSQAILTLMKEIAVDYGGKARTALSGEPT